MIWCKKYSLLLLVSFAYFKATGNIDSLKHIISKNDTIDPAVYIQLASEYTNYNTDSLMYYADKALRLSMQQNNKEQIANSYLQLTKYYCYTGAYDTAYGYAQKALNIGNDLNDNFIIAQSYCQMSRINLLKQENEKAFENAGKASAYEKKMKPGLKKDRFLIALHNIYTAVYAHLGLYDQSLRHGFRGLELTEQFHNDDIKAELYNNIASTYSYMYNTQKAIEYQRKFIEQSVWNNEPLNLQVAYVNIAHHFSHAEQYDSARYYLDKSRSILEKYPSLQREAHLYKEYGKLYHFQNRPDSALLNLQQAVTMYKQEGLEPKLADCYYWIGDVYKDKGDYKNAETYFTMSLNIHRNNGELSMVKDDYNALSVVEELKGNYQKSLEYAIAYMDLQDSLFNEKIAHAVTAQEIKYKTSLKEAQIAQQQAALQLGKQRQNWILGGGSLALVAAAGLGWLYRRSRKQKALIQKQKQEILHNNRNSIQQLISIFGRQAHTDAEQAMAQANQGRLMTLNLLNKMLYENTDSNQAKLNEYLQRLADAKSISIHIPVHLKFQDNDMLLRSSVLKDVGLIINELISNSAKHAFDHTPAPNIKITTTIENNTWLLINYRDNGCGLPAGFDIKQQRHSFGMDFICDLTEQHHGNIKWHNDSGACFNIRLKLA